MDSKHGERIIILVDMDCFYVQVEQKLCPEYQNKPCAVVQYNTWKGGGIIAVNYEARAKGVKRGARGEDAKRSCPDIHLFRVPEVRGKADLTRYREAGASVIEVLCEFSECVERASIDEAYLDVTSVINVEMQNAVPVSQEKIPNTFVVGWEKDGAQNWLQTIYEEEHLYKDRMLAYAAVIAEEMRAAVYEKTGYRCSAGIAHNKMLAKLSCGLHKPNKQTVLPESSIPLLYESIPVNKVRNLGGKFGEQVMQKFDAKMMADLMKISKTQFVTAFGEKTGSWIYNLSRGIENELVISRQLPKSIGCGKNFPGKSSLNTKEKVMHWIKQLSTELEERLLKDEENNKRAARLLTVNLRTQSTCGFSVVSRSCPIYVYDAEKIGHDAFVTIQKFNTATDSSWNPAIWSLAMAATKFEDKVDNAACDIQNYFAKSTNRAGAANIDVMVDLIDADKDLVEQSASNTSALSVGQKQKRVGEITNFFTSKQNTESNSEVDKTVVSFPNVDSKLSMQKQNLAGNTEDTAEHLKTPILPEVDESTLNKLNGTVIPESNPAIKKKGFFARKLEEHSKLLNANQCFSMVSTDKSAVSFKSGLPTDACAEIPGPSTSFAASADNDENSMSSVSSSGTNVDLDPELINLCPKCSKLIPIWEEEEHVDYHMALDLSKEFSKESSIRQIGSGSNNPVTQSTFKSKAQLKSKRKRGNMSKSTSRVKKAYVQKNTLDSFIKN